MGVVRERKDVSYPENEEPNLEGSQSVSSDTQSDDEQQVTIIHSQRRRFTKIHNSDDLITTKNNTGKRKTRRYKNRRILETLPKCDDDEADHIYEYYKGPFERLMELTDCAIDFINIFIENLQKLNDIEETILQRKIFDDPYLRISQKIRRAMKIHRNFPSDKYKEIELQVIDFFDENPNDIFISLPPNSFGRLFLHAVCQYHDLYSINIMDDKKMLVEVRNIKENWKSVKCILCDYLSLDINSILDVNKE